MVAKNPVVFLLKFFRFSTIWIFWHSIRKYHPRKQNQIIHSKTINMKNVFLILCAGLMLGVSAQAQTKKKKTTEPKVVVPENINSSFASANAGVENSKWSKNYTGNYVATFTNTSSLQQSAEYNAKGDLVKTTTTYDVAAVPANITTALQNGYSDLKITEATKVEVPGVTPFYKVRVENGETKKQKTLLISEEGAITE